MWIWVTVPWVTKLPKFRPTMQCHVGPFRSSNVLLMCWAMSYRPVGQPYRDRLVGVSLLELDRSSVVSGETQK